MDENSDTTGLNLVLIKSDKELILANYYNFRELIGKWTFISVAHYNKTNESYYPSMTRFEVLNINCPLKIEQSYNLELSPITFSNNIYALFSKFKMYSTFYVGAIAFDSIDPPFTVNLCPHSNCVKDLKPEIPSSGFKNCSDYTVCSSDCKSNILCCCDYDNNQKHLFIGNYSNFHCENTKYINFAGSSEITVENVTTAKDTHKFTLQFWIFANNYVEKKFGGMEANWKNHGAIKVFLDNDDEYYFTCIPDNINDSLKIRFIVGQWNFLHCAVDFQNKYIYLNSYDESKSSDFEGSASEGLTNFVTTKFTIKDLSKNNWGVLFLTNIRLWKDAIPSASFLAKIEINSGNKDKFNNFIYQWNCICNEGEECDFCYHGCWGNMNNRGNMVLFVFQVDVVGSHYQLQFQCLERCSAYNHLDVKQGWLTVVNPLCELPVPACHLLDDFVNVILIDIPLVSGDIVLRAVNQHDIQNIAR